MADLFHTIRNLWRNITTSGAGELLTMERRRRIVFLNSINLIGMLILFIFSTNRYLGGDINTAIADMAACSILLFTFIYMRVRKKFVFASYMIVSSVFLLFSFLLYDGGGDMSSSLWIQTYPLVAIFILGLRPGLIISTIYLAGACCIIFIPEAAKTAYGFNFGLRIVGSYMLVFMFAIFYESARRETQGKLEKLSADLLAAKKQTDSILANVKEGIFLLDNGLRMGSEYSKELERIFGTTEIEAVPFMKLLEGKTKQKVLNAVNDYLEMFFKPAMNIELLEEINPLDRIELHFKDSGAGFMTRHLEFTFTPVSREEGKVNILGTVKDVSDEVELANKLKAQETRTKKQMEQLFRIINVGPDMLTEFILDSEVEVENVNKLLKSDEKNYASIIDSMYQSVHAIKGNAILLGMTGFSRKLHSIEDELNAIKEKDLSWNDLLHQTIRLTEIKNEINDIKDLIKKVLSFQTDNRLQKIENKDLLLNAVQRTIDVMSREMGKTIKLVAEKFDSRMITAKQRKVVKDILIQLTRNALSHGIEHPDQRKALAKDDSGTIVVSSAIHDGKLTISYRDDGQGLNLQKIKNKARTIETFKDMDLDTMPEQKLLSLIFHPRFSTAEETTLSAGRGIGLNLIKSKIEQNGGNLKVRSARGKFCEFVITLPLQ
jgi:two-component system chemotaxis sensor kinase CheA